MYGFVTRAHWPIVSAWSCGQGTECASSLSVVPQCGSPTVWQGADCFLPVGSAVFCAPPIPEGHLNICSHCSRPLPWLGTVWPPTWWHQVGTPLGAPRLTQGLSLLSRIAPFSFYFLQNRVGVQIPLSLVCVRGCV